jgi:hypothetical protein
MSGQAAAQAEQPEASRLETARPDEEFLNLPLVIRTEQGEFLGVAGKLDPQFNLHAFIALLESRFHPPRHFTFTWEREEGGPALVAEQRGAPKGQRYRLSLSRQVTGKGNAVVWLQGLHIEGREAPPAYLYSFIRQTKELAPGRGA